MIAVDATTNACLGLVGGEVWTRPGVVTEHHRDRPFEDRESHRWLATAERAREVLGPAAMITVVSDRDGDIYPKWAALPQTGVHLLTRAMVDRRLVGGGTLFAAAGEIAIAGRRQIHLPARQPDRAKRTAVVELRYGAVEICRPRDEQDRTLAATVRLWLLDVREVDPPKGVEPLHWRLVTTHEITDMAKAWQVVGWYQARWIIEQLFRVMKSQGLQLEDSQLATGERLVKLAAAATRAACIDMQLVQERDGKDQLPASNVFTKPEIETLEALNPTLEGKTDRQQNLHPVARSRHRTGPCSNGYRDRETGRQGTPRLRGGLTRLRGFARLNGDFRLAGIRQVIDIYHKYYVATAEIGCSEDLPYSQPLMRPARFVRSCFYGTPNERRACPG